jgi:hypothetical protein
MSSSTEHSLPRERNWNPSLDDTSIHVENASDDD